MSQKQQCTNPEAKESIGILRFDMDAVRQNFIREEPRCFKTYSPVYVCAWIRNSIPSIKTLIFPHLKEFWSSQWPFIAEDISDRYKSEMRKVALMLKRHRIRLLHAQFATDAIFFHDLLEGCDIPVLMTIRGYDMAVLRRYPRAKELIDRVEKIIVKSDDLKNDMIEIGADPSKVVTLYGGIAVDRIPFRPRTHLPQGLKLLSAGRFVEKKGFDTTLDFFQEVLTKHPKAHLTLVGEGRIGAGIRHRIQRDKLTNHLTVKPFMPHEDFIKELYRHHVFVLASKATLENKEGIPNVLKEAMSSGMPVIATRHAGIPELVLDGETGFLADEGDPRDMARKLEKILNDAETVKVICLKAHFFVAKHFNRAKTAQKLEELYDGALLPRNARNALEVLRHGRPLQFRVDLHVTAGCNSRCIVCDNWKNRVTSSLCRTDVERLLKDLRSFGVSYIRFHGQEPTLRSDLLDILKEAKRMGFKTGLKSNALYFDAPKKIRAFSPLLDTLYLSLDAADKDIHNKMRGCDRSFRANATLAIKAKQYNPKIKIYINALITRINVKALDTLVDTAHRLRCDRVSFVHLNRKNKKNIDRLQLTTQEMREFYLRVWPLILEKGERYGIPVSVDPCFYALLEKSAKSQIAHLKNRPHDFDEEIRNFRHGFYGKRFYDRVTCYGVLDHATIDWEGRVFPCCAMPRNASTSVGNILNEPFEAIWNGKRYTAHRENVIDGHCPHRDECGRNFKQALEIDRVVRDRAGRGTGMDITQHFQYQPFREKYKRDMMEAYASTHSSFYRNKWKKSAATKETPAVNKQELKRAFADQGNMANYFEYPVDIYRTSSCGADAFLYARPRTLNIFSRIAASFIRTGGWKPGDPWLKLTSLNCLETGIPLNRNDHNRQKRDEGLTILPAHENFLEAPAALIREIHGLITASKARFIHANPTYLKFLLHRFRKERLRLTNRYIIHSTYELLLPSTKKIIEKYLSCRIFDQYGCSEIGPITFPCRFGHNHIFTQDVFVETLPGEWPDRPDIGRVAVTDLENTAMPFVKYLTGDVVALETGLANPCGIPQPNLGKVLGREDEAICYNGKTVFPLEADTIFSDLDNVLAYQIRFGDDVFHIDLVPQNEKRRIDDVLVAERCKALFADPVLDITIRRVAAIAPRRLGKHRTVIT